MGEVLLSIIVPVYGVEAYIERCMKSIIPQLSSESELVIVNDKTPDKSIDICLGMVKGLPNVKIINRAENGGLSAARNTGMCHATGKYLWFVDSDDYIEKSAITRIIGRIKENPADLYVFNHNRENSGGGQINHGCHCSDKIVQIKTDENRLTAMCEYLANREYGFEVWRRIYSNRVIRKNNIKFEPNKDIFAEDICFNLMYLNYCNELISDEGIIYNYCIRDNSIMGASKKRCKLKEMTELAYRVYLVCPHLYIRDNYHLIYSGVVNLEQTKYSAKELKRYHDGADRPAFAIQMASDICSDLKEHIRFYGKRNGLLHYIHAKLQLCNMLSKRGAFVWKIMLLILMR